MKARLFLLCISLILLSNGLLAGKSNGTKQKMREIALPHESRISVSQDSRNAALPASVSATATAGMYTGLSGYFDYQVNAGACQYIRVDKNDPSGNLIHTIFMTGSDSLDPGGSGRRTNYAYSSDGGGTWNTFGNLAVPARRSGYPSLDMLQGSTQGTIIADHNDPGSGLSSVVFVDSPPGTGAFSELNTPAQITAGSDEPIWPDVASAADGSIFMSASQSTANAGFYSRTNDFSTWSPWASALPAASAGLPTKANGNGMVAVLLNTTFAANDGIYLLESTDNGATWPAQGTLIFPSQRIAGPDTFSYTLGSDLVYNGDNVLIAAGEANIGLNAPTDSAQITFWSQATGFVVAASKVNILNAAPAENRATLNTITVDMPSIGISGTAIVIGFHVMMKNDTSANGYNNCDIFTVYSTNGGMSWSTPRNLSNSPGLDDRFVSVAPWNETGKMNLVWQEDPEAGGNIIADPGAIVRLTRQVFLKTTLSGTDVAQEGIVPADFRLEQNYPNPFNPSTQIVYSLPVGSDVRLTVYNTLGQEVATLVDGYRPAGTYRANLSGSNLSSGVYYYTLHSGQFSQTKKMILMK